jgi:hypothetical protein
VLKFGYNPCGVEAYMSTLTSPSSPPLLALPLLLTTCNNLFDRPQAALSRDDPPVAQLGAHLRGGYFQLFLHSAQNMHQVSSRSTDCSC